MNSPFVERVLLCVALHRVLLDQELHPLEEAGRQRWWLFAQQNVQRVRRVQAEALRGDRAHRISAALAVRTID